MAKRNPVQEYRRAIESRRAAWDGGPMQPLVAAPQTHEPSPPVAPGELPAWMRRTSAVTPGAVMISQSGEAILILQRANRLLGRRFGINWADAASVIFAESGRRGTSPVALARVLTAGLRRDAKESRS